MSWIRQRWGQRLWSCSFGLIGVGVAVLLSFTSLLEHGELWTQDRRFRIRGPRHTQARIVIAAISDSALAAWPEQMASWGPHYAAAIVHAKECRARWIGLDFIQAVHGDEKADRELALALHGGNVVLSQILASSSGPVTPIPTLLFASVEQRVNLGFVDTPSEVDDVVRRAALFKSEDGQLAASFPAVLALRLRGQSSADRNALLSLSSRLGCSRSGDAFWINYLGPPGSFPIIPVDRLATPGKLSDREREELRGAVVLIGPTYSGSNDVHRGPGGYDYAGVEINAHALATLIDERPLHRGSRLQEAAVAAAVGAIAALAVAAVSGWWGLTMAALACGTWWWGSVRAYQADQLWPTAGPLLAIMLSCAGQQIARAIEEARRRLRIQRVFGRYVTPDIAEYLLRHPAHLQMGGEEREVSALFVDIRGHSTTAQRHQPAAMLAQLNELFGEIVPVIQRHGGLIYGYRGDGFLAVFGAPRPLTHHAQAAVEAAVGAAGAARRVSSRRTQAGGEAVRIGCGVNTGLVVFGNLGGGNRAEFTVIGDAVNVAARLEELNKSPELNADSPSEIVISQATYERLQSPPPVQGPYDVLIRGRAGRTLVYKVQTTHELPSTVDDEAGIECAGAAKE